MTSRIRTRVWPRGEANITDVLSPKKSRVCAVLVLPGYHSIIGHYGASPASHSHARSEDGYMAGDPGRMNDASDVRAPISTRVLATSVGCWLSEAKRRLRVR